MRARRGLYAPLVGDVVIDLFAKQVLEADPPRGIPSAKVGTRVAEGKIYFVRKPRSDVFVAGSEEANVERVTSVRNLDHFLIDWDSGNPLSGEGLVIVKVSELRDETQQCEVAAPHPLLEWNRHPRDRRILCPQPFRKRYCRRYRSRRRDVEVQQDVRNARPSTNRPRSGSRRRGHPDDQQQQ